MMLQRITSDPGLGAAVARLTPKERECLGRWLAHATAKEIAIDLGITHHAVEKRLKSARSKLGVTSTLEAARLLAAADGYGSTASQSPEMGADATPPQEQVSGASGVLAYDRRATFILSGVLILSMFILAALVLGSQTARLDGPRAEQIIDVQPGNSIDLDNPVAATFARLDVNKDGTLQEAEIKDGIVMVERTAESGVAMSPLTKGAIGSFDKDKNGVVTKVEFEAGLASRSGRPRSRS